MTPEQIEATRPAFEAWFASEYHNRLDRNMPDKSYNSPRAYATWIGWQAAKADTLAQAVAPEPVRLTDAEVDSILEKPMPDGVHDHKTESYAFASDIADAIHAKGHAPPRP